MSEESKMKWQVSTESGKLYTMGSFSIIDGGLPGWFSAYHGATNIYYCEDLQEAMDYCERLAARISGEQ